MILLISVFQENPEDEIDVVSMRPTDILCSSDEEDDPSLLVPDIT